MREVFVLLAYLLKTLVKLCRPRGLYAVVAESLAVKHQLQVINRTRRRAPTLTPWDRLAFGLCARGAGYADRYREWEQGYRASLGLMRLGRQYGAERLEAACTGALRLGAYGYRTVKNILSTGLDRLPSEQEAAKPLAPMPHHDNIRGAAYYTLEETPC